MFPLGDETRRPSRFPIATTSIIAVNAFVFVLELMGGDQFVTQWSAVPAQIVSGHRLETLLTAMFMHASWSHIIGNMIFLWAFGPEIEDAMGRGRYTAFYLIGGIVSMKPRSIRAPRYRISAPAEQSPRSWARFSSPTRGTGFARSSSSAFFPGDIHSCGTADRALVSPAAC